MDNRGLGHRHVLIALFAGLLFLILSPLAALANTATLSPGQVFFERRSATEGSKLAWTWDSSSEVAFSISRSEDPGNLLYNREGTSDTGLVTVQFDDVYVLLWYNPNNSSVDLNYSASVEPGSGSALLAVVVISILVVTILLGVFVIGRRRPAKTEKESSPGLDSLDEQEHSTMASPPRPPPAVNLPQPPPPPSQVQGTQAVARFCQYCGSVAAQGSVFCSACGSRLA